MKRIVLLLAFFFAVTAGCSAQGFYLRAGLGYAVPQAGQTMDGTGQPYSGTTNNIDTFTTINVKKISFSSGIHGALGFGYMFNNHVGVDLTMDIGLSMKSYTYNENNVVYSGVTYDVQVTQKAKTPVIMIPALVLQTDGPVVNLYTRFGLALPLATKITMDQIKTNLPGAGAVETDDFNWQTKNSFSLGFSATAGVRYHLNDQFSFWGETGFLSLAVFNSQSNLTGITVTSNGQTAMYPPSAANFSVINYSKSFTTFPTDYTHQPAYSQPFSNFNFNIGCSYALGGHHRANGGGANDGGGFKRKSHSNF